MSNFPPEIEASTMEPPFDRQSRFGETPDPRDSTPTQRIIFQGGEKPWAIVGYGYGSPVVSSHKSVHEARKALV